MIDTLRPAPFASEMAISKTVAWLNEQLELGNERLLLMDCRPQELYESSHIESAINVAIPGIMLRRLQKGNLSVRALFTRSEDRDRFTRRCGTDTVVLYDESSSDWNENTGGESVLGLLLKKLKDEGCRAFYLEGTRPGRTGYGAGLGATGCGPGYQARSREPCGDLRPATPLASHFSFFITFLKLRFAGLGRGRVEMVEMLPFCAFPDSKE